MVGLGSDRAASVRSNEHRPDRSPRAGGCAVYASPYEGCIPVNVLFCALSHSTFGDVAIGSVVLLAAVLAGKYNMLTRRPGASSVGTSRQWFKSFIRRKRVRGKPFPGVEEKGIHAVGELEQSKEVRLQAIEMGRKGFSEC